MADNRRTRNWKKHVDIVELRKTGAAKFTLEEELEETNPAIARILPQRIAIVMARAYRKYEVAENNAVYETNKQDSKYKP